MKKVSREELHEAVWASPITKLAAEWEVPAYGIAKACEEMVVPRPEAGYWQRLRLGWRMAKEPLPPAKPGTAPEVVIQSPNRRAQCADAPKIPVMAKLTAPHPLVAEMKRNLQSCEPHYIFSVMDVSRRERVFRVRVTRGLIDRAMRILDAFVKGVIARGASFKAVDEWGLREVALGNETVSFILSEELERRERVARNEEEKRSYRWHPVIHHSTGRLRFTIDGFAPGNCPKEWRDGSRYRLEDKVGEMVESVFRVFEGIAELRKVQRREQEARDAERRRAEVELQRRQAELALLRVLEEKAQAWAKARDLRAFIAACEEHLAGAEWGAKWLAWARAHADRVDPITGGYLEEEGAKGT